MFGHPVLRSKPQWIPELRFGYPPLRRISKLFREKLGIFLDSLGGSQHQLFIKTRPLEGGTNLAAQREIPPHIAQYPFEMGIAEGGIARFCLVFIGYRASIAEIPLWRGGIAPPLRMLSKGGNAQKRGGRGYCTQLAMLRRQKPHSAQARGVIAEIVSR